MGKFIGVSLMTLCFITPLLLTPKAITARPAEPLLTINGIRVGMTREQVSSHWRNLPPKPFRNGYEMFGSGLGYAGFSDSTLVRFNKEGRAVMVLGGNLYCNGKPLYRENWDLNARSQISDPARRRVVQILGPPMRKTFRRKVAIWQYSHPPMLIQAHTNGPWGFMLGSNDSKDLP